MAADRTEYKFEGDATDLIKALKEVTKAMEKFTKATSKGDDAIKKEGKSATVAAKQNNRLGDSLKGLRSDFTIVAKGATNFAAGLFEIGKASFSFIQSMADAQNELSELGTRTGLTTKTLGGLRLAARISGQDLGDMEKTLVRLTKTVAKASEGSETAKKSLKALGVDSVFVGDTLKSADEILLEVTKHLSEIEDPTNRAGQAALGLGDAGTKLVAALGDQDIQDFVDLSATFGKDTGPRATKAAQDWERAVGVLTETLEPFNTNVLEKATSLLNNFGIGLIYIGTLLTELAKNPVSNLKDGFLLLFAHLTSHAVDFAENFEGFILSAFETVQRGIAWVTGDDTIVKAIEDLKAARKETHEATRLELQDLKEKIATNSTLADTYKKAAEAATAYYLAVKGTDQEAEAMLPTTKPEEKEEEKKIGEIKEKEADKKEELSDMEKGALLLDSVAARLDGLIDPTGIFKKLLLDVGDSLLALNEWDSKNLQDKFLAIGEVVGNVFSNIGNVLGKLLADKIPQDLDTMTDKQRKKLMVLFAAQKAAAIAQITVETATAIMKGFSLFGPPPSPVGIASAAAIGTIGAAQIAVVAGQKPKFHTGGIIPAPPGDQGIMMNALPGEAVLNREATAGLGAEGVSALNSGTAGGGAIAVSMIYKHRIFDNFVQDNISKGGPLRDAIKGGQRVGHKGR